MLDALIKVIRAAIDTVLVRLGQGMATFIATALGLGVPAGLAALDPANQPAVKNLLQPPQGGNLETLFPWCIDLLARALEASLILATVLGFLMVLQIGLKTGVSHWHIMFAAGRSSRVWYWLFVLLMVIGYFIFVRLSPIYDNLNDVGQLSRSEWDWFAFRYLEIFCASWIFGWIVMGALIFAFAQEYAIVAAPPFTRWLFRLMIES